MPKIDRTAIPTSDRWLTEQRWTHVLTTEEAQLSAVKVARDALASVANAMPEDRPLPTELLAAYEAVTTLERALAEGVSETGEEVS